MNSSHVYVPIIKGKRNDVDAVGRLADDVRERTKPLIEAMPADRTKQGLEDHVKKFVHYVVKFIPSGELFVDFYGLMPEQAYPDGSNATIAGFKLLKSLGRVVTPTYGLARNDRLWRPLRSVVESFDRGFCFRLSLDDLDDNAEDTWSQLIERSSDLGLAPGQIDILLDLRFVGDKDEDVLRDVLVDFIAQNRSVSAYRSVVVAGSSAIRTVSEITKDGIGEILRKELGIWSALRRDVDGSLRLLFGDYGIVHPDFSDLGSSKNMNAKIRYTVGNRIIYYRGHGLIHPKKDFLQYHDLAKKVRSDKRYKGASESFGDSYVYQCANRLIKPGSPSTWIRADMNHHISYTARQIDRLLAVFSRNNSDSAAKRALEAI